LDRALHALTSLQSDVDNLLVASKEGQGQGQHEQPLLLLQSKQHAAAAGLTVQPQQQVAGSNWSVASGWAAAGSADGRKPDSSNCNCVQQVAAPAQQPSQQNLLLPQQPPSLNSQHQQQQQQDAAAADLADFEAELLQAEAAAPGRRLSEETLKQYTALVWHSSIDGMEGTTYAADGSAAAAVTAAGGALAAAAASHAAGNAGSGVGRLADMQQLGPSGKAEPGGPAAAVQHEAACEN
jgi:hypothetical protein